MATISNTPRPGYVWDSTDNVWYPIGTGPHTHADYITSGSAINPTIVDAKGDIIAATAADTVARLAVGANDTVLTADSSTATGLKWAAVAAGAGNIAQIATGTLSGATGATLTGLTSYSELILKADSVTWATANSQFLLRLNNDSTSNYSYFGNYQTNQPAGGEIFSNSDTCFRFTKASNALYNGVSNCYIIKITNCKSTGYTDVHIISAYQNQSFYMYAENSMGVFRVNGAISSIDLLISAGYSFNGGAYTLWGA